MKKHPIKKKNQEKQFGQTSEPFPLKLDILNNDIGKLLKLDLLKKFNLTM
jgi:hypothetical protein